jgi:hypothetical protein
MPRKLQHEERFLLGQGAIKPVAGHFRAYKVLSPAAISGPTEKVRKRRILRFNAEGVVWILDHGLRIGRKKVL